MDALQSTFSVSPAEWPLPAIDAARADERQSWFAVFTKSHHEKRVAQYLVNRDLESYLPLYSEVHHWTNRRKANVELPLFPNYLFARVGNKQVSRLLQAPGVLSVVGGRKPVSLPEWEIESLRAGLGLRKAEPHPYLVVGERVTIRNGALSGMQGVLIRKKNSLRVVLTVAEIGQGVAIEVDAADIEPVAKAHAARAGASSSH
jgi:transcription antitermination factor NusG